MNYLNRPEYKTEFNDWDATLYFRIDEACQLLNLEIVRVEDRSYLPLPPNEKVGIVVGVLTMNEEIEVLVRFVSSVEQLIKTEFCGDYIVVPNQ